MYVRASFGQRGFGVACKSHQRLQKSLSVTTLHDSQVPLCPRRSFKILSENPFSSTHLMDLCLRLHVRDAYGNRMLENFTSQLLYHTASTSCNPRDPQDVNCTPIDEAGPAGRGHSSFWWHKVHRSRWYYEVSWYSWCFVAQKPSRSVAEEQSL